MIAGPVEATASGNVLVQVRSSGELGSLSEMRSVIRKSSEVKTFDPKPNPAWENAAARFAELARA